MKVKFQVGAEESSLEIPPNVWNAYLSRVEQHLPNEGKKAWAAYIVHSIAALLGDKQVFLLTDIPPEVTTAFEKTCQEVNLNPASVLPSVMQAALKDQLHITSFLPEKSTPREKNHVALLLNIPPPAWEAWDKVGIECGLQGGANLFGMILEAAYNGNLSISKKVEDDASVSG